MEFAGPYINVQESVGPSSVDRGQYQQTVPLSGGIVLFPLSCRRG